MAMQLLKLSDMKDFEQQEEVKGSIQPWSVYSI